MLNTTARTFPVTPRSSNISNTQLYTPNTITQLTSFLTFLSVLVMTGWLLGCPRTPATVSEQARSVKSAIILVPGYYGTRLIRKSDRSLVFVSPTQVLFGDEALTLPVPGLGFEGTIELEPDGILDEVGVIPPFYSIDVYGSLLDRLATSTHPGLEVIPFTYDWRRDLMEAVQSLDTLIHRLQAEGTEQISLVAHSMGGLIVSYYLRYGTQEIDSAVETWKGAVGIQEVVMAGVPFLGAMNSFRNMNFGATIWWNSSLLSSEAYASFPASYYTLPVADADELLAPSLNPLKGFIRDGKQWQQSEWGLLKNTKDLSNEIVKRRADYTSHWLRRSQRFLELIRAPTTTTSPHRPSLLYVYAKGTPTLAKGRWSGNRMNRVDSLFFGDPEKIGSHPESLTGSYFENGDGTVTMHSAHLPLAYQQTFPTTIREYEVEHTELVTDPDIQKDIIRFLDGRKTAIQSRTKDSLFPLS